MPRVTLLRLVILLPILCYLTFILLWVAIPSPPNAYGVNNDYQQRVLRSGQTLTTSYTNSYIYDSPKDEDNYKRSHFAVDWQLVQNEELDATLLRIGTDGWIDLTNLTNHATPFTDIIISDAVAVTVKSCGLDGVMMPWFDDTDCCVLNWDIERQPQVIEVRAVVPEQGVVQIWPENPLWHTKPLKQPEFWHNDFAPFMVLSNVVQVDSKIVIAQIDVTEMVGEVPTKTYPIRWFLITVLKPITLGTIDFIDNYVAPTAMFILTILSYMSMLIIFTVACWIASALWSEQLPLGTWLRERFWFTKWMFVQPFNDWFQKFWITRWMYPMRKQRTIMGPGGVIALVDDEDYLHLEEDDVGFIRPVEIRTLRGPLDFFRSPAPLDDLLNTFESTRWMTAPLSSSSTHRRDSFEPSDGVTVSTSQEKEVTLRG